MYIWEQGELRNAYKSIKNTPKKSYLFQEKLILITSTVLMVLAELTFS